MTTNKNYVTTFLNLLKIGSNDLLVQGFKDYLSAKQFDLANVNKTISPLHFETAEKSIVGSSIINFFDTESKAGEHFAILGMRVLQANSASAQPRWTKGAFIDTSLSATIDITNAGLREVVDLPMTAFLGGGGTTNASAVTDPSEGEIIFNRPILWVGQTKLTVALKFPTGVTQAVVATLDVKQRFELIGIKLVA
jgi:hypothetical protein